MTGPRSVGGLEIPRPTGSTGTRRPRVVHCKVAPPGSFVPIGRPSILGNPFRLSDPSDPVERARCIARFERYFAERVERDAKFRAAVLAVRGQDLGCYCKTKREPDRPCHGDVILAWLERHVTA